MRRRIWTWLRTKVFRREWCEDVSFVLNPAYTAGEINSKQLHSLDHAFKYRPIPDYWHPTKPVTQPAGISKTRTFRSTAAKYDAWPAVVLLLALASTASAAEPCSGSLGLWSGTQTSSGGNQSVVVGSRAEGGCDTVAGIRAFGRLDAYPLRGKTVALTDPATFENVSAVEGWGGLSKRVVGSLSVAVFGGLQRSLEGGELGIGGATQSLCVGGRLDYYKGLAIGGFCNRYSPAQTFQDGQRKDGPAFVGTVVLPVRDHVRFAANGAYLLRTKDYTVTVGPVVSVGR